MRAEYIKPAISFQSLAAGSVSSGCAYNMNSYGAIEIPGMGGETVFNNEHCTYPADMCFQVPAESSNVFDS